MIDKQIDRSKLFIISVDGLDVSGKETFCKNLLHTLREELVDKSLLNANVKMVSFPRYETNIGADIKELLNTDIKVRDINELEKLFVLDRVEFFNDYFKNTYDNNKMNIIICDRYAYSNFIYSFLRIMNEKDIPSRTLFKNEQEEKLKLELQSIPTPDLTVIFNRVSESSRNVHRELIKSKSSKDMNETEEIQEYLSSILNNDLIEVIDRYSSKTMVVPVGSNFNSNQIELGISTLVTTKMVNNGLDTIMYPSSVIYRNNETENLIGDLKFIPSVEIKFLIDIDNTEVNKFISDVKNDIIRRKTLSNLSNDLDILKPEDKDFYTNLISEYSLDYLSNYNNLDNFDSVIRSKIRKNIFTPRKTSKLNCNYSIVTPKNIHMDPKSVQAIDLEIDVLSIDALSTKTSNSVIDLDIKTHKECILTYGVGVADSPSSISSDYKGTLSIILINHTDKSIDIPFGFPIASLVVKNSSCETLFTIVEK